MRPSAILIILLASASFCGAAQPPNLYAQFKRPGPEYRAAPFLSLNDDLNARELDRQIRELKSQGAGGFFLHPRVGVITPYMSAKWLDLMAGCADDAERARIYAWLYDEDRWPSGFASGMVPAKGMEYRARSLDLREFDISRDTKIEEKDAALVINGLDNIIAWFACARKDDKIEDLRRLPLNANHGLPEGTHILLFRMQIAPNSAGFNGYSYVDVLNPDVIKAFIETTYEPYFKKLGSRFGKEVPGIFTDEPNVSATAWTERLPDQFRTRCGYDLLDRLPSLYYEVGDWRKVRYDYRSLMTDMFVTAYSKQLYDWCEKHHIQFTGHYLAEDTLLSQLREAGACMPHYEYQQMPGIDHLFRRLVQITTMKQAGSAANQLGRKRVLSETFGGSGWNMSFGDQRWIANWQLALGVNFMNPHLCHYSLRGTRKRDWPPSLYFQQPYWKHYGPVNDYLGRGCMMLTRGDFVADVLVIHPIASAWCLFSPNDASKAGAFDKRFLNLSTNLAQLHREFEYGDETLMAKYGKVAGSDLIVGRMKYRVVVIPPSVTLSSSTFRLLNDFLKAGGRIIALKPTPTLLDGAESSEVAGFFERKSPNLLVIEDDRPQLEAALQTAAPAGISVKDESGQEAAQVVIHRRQDGKRHIVFLANTDPAKPCDVALRVDTMGKLEDWSLETGDVGPISSRLDGSAIFADVHLAEGGSKLLVIDETRDFKPFAATKPTDLGSVELSTAWRVRRLSPNSLVLDTCSYRIGDGVRRGPVPVFKVQQEMDGQPEGTQVSLRYNFNVAFEPDGRPIYAVMEQPGIYSITLNTQPISNKDAGWWVDTSFRKVDISRAVMRGENFLEMTCKFQRPTKPGTAVFVPNGVEIESVYIIGDFAVQPGSTYPNGPAGTTVAEGDFKLVQEAPVPIIGDLVPAGYPFFAGDIELSQTVDVGAMPNGRAYLELDGLNAIVARVRINGHEAGVLYWPPFRLDVTDYLEKGTNRVQVILSNSLRNLLGPLHHKAGELTVASPNSFTDGANWTDAYHFVKLGIPGKAEIAWEE